MDARYKWLFPVKDEHGQDATLAIGLDDGHVIVSLPQLGWCRIDDLEMVEAIGYEFTIAAYAARERRRKQTSPMVIAEDGTLPTA